MGVRYDMLQLTEMLKGRITVESFIEIGSRDGHDTNYVSHYWNIKPENCYIIEAHPYCFEYIKNFYGHFKVLNVAASDKTGVITFNAGSSEKSENLGISSILDRTLNEFVGEKIEIDAWRMDEIMLYFNIDKFDLAKIDVEGFSLPVLQGFGDKLSTLKAIQIELETKQVWEGQYYYDDIVNYLSQYGFTILDDVQLDDYQKDVLFIKNNL